MASSDKAYGEHKILPYHEDMPLMGMHRYDVSKSCADLIARTYAHSYGLGVVITCCGKFFGGGYLNWNRPVPGTIRAVLHGERPVIRREGQFIRDYIYVQDGAAACMHLAEQLSLRPDLRGEAFNFSSEIRISVFDLLGPILRQMRSDLEPEIRNEASNEIRNQYLSAEKARRERSWTPRFTLDCGLRLTIEWYRQFFSRE